MLWEILWDNLYNLIKSFQFPYNILMIIIISCILILVEYDNVHYKEKIKKWHNIYNKKFIFITKLTLLITVFLSISYFTYNNYYHANPIENNDISITSFPSGACICVDGETCGETPMILKNIEQGSHKITLQKKDYETWSQAISVSAGKEVSISPTLTPTTETSTPTITETSTPTITETSTPTITETSTSTEIPLTVTKKMEVGKTQTVCASINKDIFKNIIEENGISETFKSTKITTDPVVKLTLVGGEPSAFEVDAVPPNSEDRSILNGTSTTWRWQVTPLKSGKHTLLLSAGLISDTDTPNVLSYNPLRNEEEEIEVNFNVIYFFKDNWKWFLEISITLLFICLYIIYFIFKDKFKFVKIEKY